MSNQVRGFILVLLIGAVAGCGKEASKSPAAKKSAEKAPEQSAKEVATKPTPLPPPRPVAEELPPPVKKSVASKPSDTAPGTKAPSISKEVSPPTVRQGIGRPDRTVAPAPATKPSIASKSVLRKSTVPLSKSTEGQTPRSEMPEEAPATVESAPRKARSLPQASPPSVESLPPPAPLPTSEPIAKKQSEEDRRKVRVFFGTNRQVASANRDDNRIVIIPWVTAFGIGGLLSMLALFVMQYKSYFIRGVGLLIVGSLAVGSYIVVSPWLKSLNPVEFGNEIGDLIVGECMISIPHDHRMGRLESPSVLRGEFKPDEKKHVVVLKVSRTDRVEFAKQVSEVMDKKVGSVRRAFVFIHGFNVSFIEAARRTGQIAYDLEFDGAPAFFSWPANGDAMLYRNDELAVETGVPALREFLELLADQTNAEEIHLIAHSMGNRCLTGALKQLSARDVASNGKFKEVMLTAPDISERTFRKEIFPLIKTVGRRHTLYASSNDLALKFSRQLNGEKRLGDATGGVLVLKNLDSIDVSAIDTSFIGHNYYGDNSSVITDIRAVLNESSNRDAWAWVEPFMTTDGPYWVFRSNIASRPRGNTR